MSPTPPSTTSSSAGAPSPDAQHRVVRRRNRIPLSCGPCRNRKLKCNRANPCENCVKRGEAAVCAYAPPGSRKKNQSSPGSSSSDEMQNRIDRLEGLVLSLMTNGAQSAGLAAANSTLSRTGDPRPSDNTPSVDDDDDDDDDDMIKEESDADEHDLERVTDSFGFLKVDANRSTYFGNNHWATIINDIAEVKSYFAEHKKQYEEQMQKVAATRSVDGSTTKGPALLFSTSAPPERSELLSALPQRHVVDKLVNRFLNAFDPTVHFFHGPTFRKQYEAHWANPSSTSVIWLGQLFSMMCLAMQAYHRDGDEPPEYKGRSMEYANVYRKRTAECVAVADFCKPDPTMLETLIMYLHAEHQRSRDCEVSVWVLSGMVVRLAFRMGYHRDPKPYANITPFQGEMRRRVWIFIRSMDTLFSFQIGLPGMIRSADCDTALPRSLYDDELGEDIKELPPSRPLTEPTPVAFLITKATLAFQFSKIVEQTNLLGQRPYEEVMRLDQDLRDARAAMPPHLQLRPMGHMMMDPLGLIMQRYILDLLYQKGQCVLHRKFLTRGRVNPRYAHSRRACVDASMELLRHQATLHNESQAKGRMRSVKWFISSLTSQDFMLAAMIVCLDLYYGEVDSEAPSRRSSEQSSPALENRREEMIKAIKTSREAWREFKDGSMEAYKAFTTLTIMLEKVETANSSNANAQFQPMPFAFPGMSPATSDVMPFDQDVSKPEHSAAMTLGLLSSGGLTPNPAVQFDKTTSLVPGNVVMTEAGSIPPSFGMDNSMSSMSNATGASPFSALAPPAPSLDMPINLNWDAWDSFVQENSFDPMTQFWPNGMDLSIPSPGDGRLEGMQETPTTQPERHQRQQEDEIVGSGRVFMGVNTPPSNTTI